MRNKPERSKASERRLVIVKRCRKYGLFTREGVELFTPQYESLKFLRKKNGHLSNEWFIARKNGKKILVNINGKEFEYDDEATYSVMENGLLSVCKNGRYGIMESSGKFVLSILYASIELIMNEGYIVEDENGFFGKTDLAGKTLLPCKFTYLRPLIPGYSNVKEGGKMGTISNAGYLKLDYEYDSIVYRDEVDIITVSQRKGEYKRQSRVFALIDRQFNPVSQWIEGHLNSCYYGDVMEFTSPNDQTGLLRINGTVILPPRIQLSYWVRISLLSDLYVLNNQNEIRILKFIYAPKSETYLTRLKRPEDKIITQRDGKWAFSRTNDGPVVSEYYDAVWKFFCGRAVVVRDCKFGYIDEEGREIIPCQFDAAFRFVNDVARVYGESGEYSIDKAGNRI